MRLTITTSLGLGRRVGGSESDGSGAASVGRPEDPIGTARHESLVAAACHWIDGRKASS